MKDVFYFCVLVFGLVICYGESKTYDEMKPNVGKHVILEGDTLLITDFNSFESNYQLSNGVTIYKNFGDELITK